jgi:autotransporter-associated beta strand protein
MIRPRLHLSLRACAVAALAAATVSPAFAVSYTWVPKSGTGDWTTSLNWTGTSATDLYPGSTTSTDTADARGDLVGDVTLNLDTSVSLQNLFLGDTTGTTTSGTFYATTVSTTNNSTLTFEAASAAANLAQINNAGGVANGTANLVTPNIIVNSGTLEVRKNLSQGGGADRQNNIIISGNVTSGVAGGHQLRFTPTSSSTGSSLLEYSGDITNGVGTINMVFRVDATAAPNTLRLSGTGNTFTGGITFNGGRPERAFLEASPASGTTGALSTGGLTLGTSGSFAALNLGGSPTTVTEVCNVSAGGTGPRRIAVIGAGDRILSGTVTATTTGTLTLACSSAGSLTFSNAFNGTGPIRISSTGSGKVIFAGAASAFSGSTTVQAGSLQLASGSPLGTSRVTPVAGGTLSLSPYATTTVGGLAPNAGGLTDLGNGFLSVTSGLTATDLVTAIVAGRNGGSWDGTTGITSSTVAAAVAAGSPRAVGWLDNGDGSVSAAYAAPGDTNIDWSIDILDASNFLAGGKFDAGVPATWNEGDFSYDGIVDILDAADFFATGLYDAGNYNTAPAAVGGVAAVPEPAGLGAIGLVAAAGIMVRRREAPRPRP